MPVLEGFVMVSQLTTITEDGLPNKDAPYECVAASLCAGAMYLNGIKQIGGKYTPDWFKDQAYGEDYMGGTAARNYIDVCKQLGVKLYPLNGNPGQLVKFIHDQLAQKHPVIVTVPDVYVPSSYGWTHVLCACGDSTGIITCLDPYIGKPLTRSDQEWINLLLDNEIWILQKEDEVLSIDLNTPGISNYFTLVNGDQWQCKQTQKIIHGAILAEYCRYGGAGLCGLTHLGLPVSGEIAIPNASPCVKQFFERGVLIWDPNHSIDNPPGADNVYTAHLYGGQGEDPRVAEMKAQIDQLKQQLANQPQPDPAPLNAIHQIQTLVAPFK